MWRRGGRQPPTEVSQVHFSALNHDAGYKIHIEEMEMLGVEEYLIDLEELMVDR
jgi:hypothetical protein